MIEFRKLNLDGFRKILKKHDKVLEGLHGAEKLSESQFPGIKERLEALDLTRMQVGPSSLEMYVVAGETPHRGSLRVVDDRWPQFLMWL